MNIIDISRPLLTTIEYPGDPETRLDTVRSISKGDGCNLSAVYACVHTATHADAPKHFLDDGQTIDEVDLHKYIGRCTVIEVPPGVITGEYVDRYFPKKCERLIIKGDSQSVFMESAAYEALDCGICLIGTDADSVGYSGSQMKTHKAFLQNDVAILENLDLSAVEPGDYYLIAFPVKMGAIDGAPVRAVLIDDYILWNKI
ncbi:MAG: cyclase family protein [Ruminococcus sp.]|nr:cyclase family protein [Candidatus Copronaster equi]